MNNSVWTIPETMNAIRASMCTLTNRLNRIVELDHIFGDRKMEVKITSIKDVDERGKKVLMRLYINSPIDPITKMIVNVRCIGKMRTTLRYLLDNGAAVAIIAHQGDTLDYQNLIPMKEHACSIYNQRLQELPIKISLKIYTSQLNSHGEMQGCFQLVFNNWIEELLSENTENI